MPVKADLICLACRGALTPGEEDWNCGACGASYRATLGIPDLRGARGAKNNAALVATLVKAYPRASFEELVELRQAVAQDLPEDLRAAYAGYRRTMLARGRRLYEMFQLRLAEAYGPPARGLALDLGCGVGASTLAMAGDFERIAALDPGLPDLILARKALEEHGVENVTLAQAYAQRVPLPDGTCDYVSAQNVLEHVIDLEGALAQVGRVLKPGGAFTADSRNRYDLLFLEPHVRLRWVGFLPWRWQPAYVRWRRGLRYDDTKLLSYGELRQALRRHVGARVRIVFPLVTAYGGGARMQRVVARLEAVPVLAGVALRLFPTQLALALKD